MNGTDFIWWLGLSSLLMYLGALVYIMTGVALSYYRGRDRGD